LNSNNHSVLTGYKASIEDVYTIETSIVIKNGKDFLILILSQGISSIGYKRSEDENYVVF
jgi:hypothetical protein